MTDVPDRGDVEPLTPAHPAWRQFELDVTALAAELDPEASVTHNVRRTEVVSGRLRQIDALVVGKLGLSTDLECKRNTASPLGIGVVDEFVGKCTDVGVDRGVLCAWGGFNAGAKARAAGSRHPKIELRGLSDLSHLVPWAEVAEEFLRVDCPVDGCWGELLWTDWPGESGGITKADRCGSCGTLSAECPVSGSVTALDVGLTRCRGCDVVFEATMWPGEPDIESITVVWPEGAEE